MNDASRPAHHRTLKNMSSGFMRYMDFCQLVMIINLKFRDRAYKPIQYQLYKSLYITDGKPDFKKIQPIK